MDEFQKKAFDAALDLVKQLIALATGTLALTTTFLKDLAGLSLDKIKLLPHFWTLYGTWASMLLSILCGLLAHGAITGTLDNLSKPKKEQKAHATSLYGLNIQVVAIAQWVVFLCGIILLVVFSFSLISR